jgi:transposase
VPPAEIRELRDLTRYRTQVIRQRADECNRIRKLPENGNIKLASVASNVLGAGGRDMLRAPTEGADDPQALADLARGRSPPARPPAPATRSRSWSRRCAV